MFLIINAIEKLSNVSPTPPKRENEVFSKSNISTPTRGPGERVVSVLLSRAISSRPNGTSDASL